MEKYINLLNIFIVKLESGELQHTALSGDWPIKITDNWSFNPNEGICSLISQLGENYDSNEIDILLQKFFLHKTGKFTHNFLCYPVSGRDEYLDNDYLWWDDKETGSYPSWQKRIALLKEFIQFLEGKQNEAN